MKKATAAQVSQQARAQARAKPAAATPMSAPVPPTPTPQKQRTYADSTKASSSTQWNESEGRPVLMQAMTLDEIEEFRNVLAKTYRYELSEVKWEFEPIRDVNDVDHIDCVLLVYYAPRGPSGEERKHCLWKKKIPVPSSHRERADKIRQEELLKRSNQPAAPVRRRPQAKAAATKSTIIVEEIISHPQIEPKSAEISIGDN